MVSLLELPSTILTECAKYIHAQHVFNFLTANKSVLYKIKKETSFFRLSIAQSVEYYKTS
jgi:hypothetical protein